MQQVVTPLERVAEGLVPCGKVARAAGQQFEFVIETRQDRLWLQEFDARRGKFEGKRKPIETAADFSDGRGVVFPLNRRPPPR
jgi:hypothetical protein